MKNRYEIVATQRVQDGSFMQLPTSISRRSAKLAEKLAEKLARSNGQCLTVTHRATELEFEVVDRKTGRTLATFDGGPAVTVSERGVW